MDKSLVAVGDPVYDLAFGAGKVTEVQENEQRLVVVFGERRFSYNALGVGHFPTRTLYWRNPIIGVPPKDQVRWELYRRLCNAISQIALGE